MRRSNSSRETEFSGANGDDNGTFSFHVQLTKSRIGNLTWLICADGLSAVNSREIRTIFSDKEAVFFRGFGGNDYRLRPFTAFSRSV